LEIRFQQQKKNQKKDKKKLVLSTPPTNNKKPIHENPKTRREAVKVKREKRAMRARERGCKRRERGAVLLLLQRKKFETKGEEEKNSSLSLVSRLHHRRSSVILHMLKRARTFFRFKGERIRFVMTGFLKCMKWWC